MSTPGDSSKPVIRITEADVTQASTTHVVNQLQAAQEVPLVRSVGDERRNSGSYITLLWMALAGGGGGILTWAFWNIFPEPDDATASNLQTSILLVIGIAVVLIAVDSGLTRSWPKVGRAFLIALPVALVASLLFGAIANVLYQSWVEDIFDNLVASGLDPVSDAFWAEFSSRNHLGRGAAWSLMGLAAGLAVGISSLAPRRILVTAAGGLIGGFLGGFLFDFFTGEGAAQVAGLVVTGISIGISIGLIEQVAKSSWLEIVQGGMAGKQFILYKADVTIGSAPSADVTLIKDPAIPGVAATISRRAGAVMIQSNDPMRPVLVDGVVVNRVPLREGALIELGATVVRYRVRNSKDVSASIVRN